MEHVPNKEYKEGHSTKLRPHLYAVNYYKSDLLFVFFLTFACDYFWQV